MKTNIISEFIKYESIIEKQLHDYYFMFNIKKIDPFICYYQIQKPYIYVEEVKFNFQNVSNNYFKKTLNSFYFYKKFEYQNFQLNNNKSYIATEHPLKYDSKLLFFGKTLHSHTTHQNLFYLHIPYINKQDNPIIATISIREFNKHLKKSIFDTKKLIYSQQNFDSIINYFNS